MARVAREPPTSEVPTLIRRIAFAFLMALVASSALAQLSVDVSQYGGLDAVRVGGRVVARDVQVRVVKPGWSGAWGAQAPGGGLEVSESADAGARLFTGRMEAEGDPIDFECRVAPEGDGTRLSWKLTPTADLDTELIGVFADLPVAGNAGQGTFLTCDGTAIERRPLPADLPESYHLAGKESVAWFGWALPGDVGLRLEPGRGLGSVSFQDNRQFGGDCFQAQLPVADTHGLKAGRTYEFSLTLRAFGQAALDEELKTMVDLQNALVWPMTSDRSLVLRGLRLSSERVPVHEKLEIDLDLDASYDNPFDPRDIDILATFAGPGGHTLTVPGFLYQGYDWLGPLERNQLHVVGRPVWKVRFAPPEVGRWEVRVRARDRSGEVVSEPSSFECVPGDDPGFVRPTPANPFYLRYDNGQQYYAIGENVCWGRPDEYATWFSALGAAGANYCRIWMVRWNMGLEWTPDKGTGTYHGLGRYSQDNAYRLDYVLDQARRNGIYTMLCLGYHGELLDQAAYFGEQCWTDSPYNRANGGPCDKPAEFWTNEEARRAYRQRLRYLIARWGYATHVLSWELWNEVEAPAPWVKEMAGYLQSEDPFGHLVTTTYGNDEVWRLDEIDYTQAHTYGSDEGRQQTVPAIAALGREHTGKWPKPFMIGEFGIDWKTSDSVHDPQGLGTSLHDGLWASVMTRCFGGAAIWYWDGYVHPKNLYGEFTALRRFVDTVPWPKLRLASAEFGTTTIPAAVGGQWGDICLQGTLGWMRQPDADLVVGPDGKIQGDKQFTEFLFSDSKPDMKAPMRFHVTYPRDGWLVLHVGTINAGAVLHVLVDGAEVWSQDLPAGEGEGEWKSTKYMAEWNTWQSTYDRDYEVPIAAGEHTIELENSGPDWVTVTGLTFTGCRDPRLETLDLLGLRTDEYAILWIHDPASNWYDDKYGRLPGEIADAKVTLVGLRDRAYQVEWWDTRKGDVVSTAEATSTAGSLVLAVPAFSRDIAAKVRP